MLKSFVIKAYLVSLLIQQVVGSPFFIVEVDKVRSVSTSNNRVYWTRVNCFEQKDSVFNKTLINGSSSSPGLNKVIFNEYSGNTPRTYCEILDESSPYKLLIIYLLGVGNNYLTGLKVDAFDNSGFSTHVPCLRTDDDYRHTTYTCGDSIPKDLIEVPKDLPKPPTTTTIPKPTGSSISSSSSATTTTTTTTKSSSSLKPTPTTAPSCKTGYCGKKRGNGPTGACCSSSDDCLDTCNSNGKCGVSDETGEPKTTTCPA
ncbi:unnamed protein product [Cunninghamella blakesleeana]